MLLSLVQSAQGTEHEHATDTSQRVQLAIQNESSWDGPTTGPALKQQRQIILVASDLRNGGVNAVAKGMSEALTGTDWNLGFLDGMGSPLRQGIAIRKAIAANPDGIVLCGLDANQHKDVLALAKQRGITVVGWHAADQAGPRPESHLFTNITTDPIKVAEIAALLAISDSAGQVRAVIFTDSRYQIAKLKAERMAAVLHDCKGCDVLEVKEVPLDQIADRMPDELETLMQEYPQGITHLLVINDLYIDFAVPTLERRHENDQPIPQTISAGDGSRASYRRIRQGLYQRATVPEPLTMQGWQIVDELNRAFNQAPPSGYSAPVHLVTRDNIGKLGKRYDVYDPINRYRDAYRAIWSLQ